MPCLWLIGAIFLTIAASVAITWIGAMWKTSWVKSYGSEYGTTVERNPADAEPAPDQSPG